MALLEAAALNCEIIATRTGAIPEILGDYAHYVPYGDVNATCDMIERCLTSYAKSDIQNIVRDRFSVERRESALGRIIDSLIQHMNHDNKLIATNKG
jgi:glycosyltransferase involved in cell wall biosynthesis